MNNKKWILPIIVFAQFCCTSLWFAGNGIMADLVRDFDLNSSALGHLTSAVQLGFITGTLVFALLSIADRYSPSRVFFISAQIGGLFNLGIILEGNTMASLLSFRFLTGFFLAGIYPVGMKIAADYYQKGLGRSLGYLVGALVIGTALPHLVKGFTISLDWQFVLIITSSLAAVGGLLVLTLVPNGPYRKRSQKLDFSVVFKVFKNRSLRTAALGYFGHMWELYAFWAFVPVMLATYISIYPDTSINMPVLSFLIIAIGGLACVLGGYLSQKMGSKKTATIALLLSCSCCILSPLIFYSDSGLFLVIFLLFWGMMVVADSPLFSTLVAHNAAAESKATALTIVNSIGFAISILSIQLLTLLREIMDLKYIYVFLALGPIMGLVALFSKTNKVAIHHK